MEFLEELFIQEGILLDPNSEGYKSAYGDDVTLETIQLLQRSVEELELEAQKVESFTSIEHRVSLSQRSF